MTFPSDIKGCMRDCILSLLWPRKDIYQFFADHSCEKSDLAAIANFENMSRVEMIDTLFAQLDEKRDGGIGPFRAMLQSLLTWSHFDAYYFDKLKKLDRSEATRKLAHLSQLQEIRDAQIRKDRVRRESAESESQQAKQTLEELRTHFLELHAGKLSAQKRGYALENILCELSRLSGLEVTEPFRVNGEQIDGAVKYDGEHYLIEAKWQEASANNSSVYQFAAKVEGKMYGRGLFVSIQGFSDHVGQSLVAGKALRTVFVDGEDLIYVLDAHLTFRDLIDRKVRAAQTKGLIYVHALTGTSKIQ